MLGLWMWAIYTNSEKQEGIWIKPTKQRLKRVLGRTDEPASSLCS